MDELRKLVEKAINRAFSMGQKYWADAYSESYSANARADKTMDSFNAMRDETLAALAAIPADAVEHRLWDTQWVNVVNAPEVLQADDADEAVARAVKLTERFMAKNIATNNFPPLAANSGGND